MPPLRVAGAAFLQYRARRRVQGVSCAFQAWCAASAAKTELVNAMLNEDEWLRRRRAMVDEQLRPRGIRDERVLQAMTDVPRERFVPGPSQRAALDDRALPVSQGQTISQPFIVAYMTEKLKPTPACRVLEVGTGTGYQTAVLAALCKHIYTIERIEELSVLAMRNLQDLDVANVSFVIADGSLGCPAHAPYDRILVTAGAPHVPATLVEQLADGGRLVIPVGGPKEQKIVCVTRRGEQTTQEESLPCRFVKLIGEDGWSGRD